MPEPADPAAPVPSSPSGHPVPPPPPPPPPGEASGAGTDPAASPPSTPTPAAPVAEATARSGRPQLGRDGTAGRADEATAGLEEAELAGTDVEEAATRKLGFMGWFSILWLAVLTLAALLAPALPIPDPNESYLEIVRQGPIQPGHVLGGDGNGRDMLSRVIFGARTSLMIGFVSVLLAFVVGGALGLVAGYFKGRVDTVLSTLFNVVLSIPSLVLVLAFVAVFASSDQEASNARRVTVLILSIALVSVPLIGRIARAATMAWSEREFVRAAEVLGARHSRIIFREVLPNVLPAMASIALLGIGTAIVAEGGLALLGAGVTDVASWGNMISLGRPDLARAPHIVGIPSVAIFLTILALNYLGDVVRARFDVREAML